MSTQPVNLTLVAGPQLIGFFFNWALLGVLNIQVYLYYGHFPKDRLIFKCLVYGLLAFEWVHTGLITAGAFKIHVYDYGNVESLLELHNAWFAVPIMCAIVSVIVELFFAWRIYMLAKSRILTSVIVILSITQGVGAIVVGAMLKPKKFAQDLDGRLLPPILIWIVGAALTDILIAVSMTILLLKVKNGIRRTDALVNRAIQLVVETGTLTASLAVIMVVFGEAPVLKNTLLYEAISLILTKLYANTFLTNLNSRAYLRGQSFLEPISLCNIECTAGGTRTAPLPVDLGQQETLGWEISTSQEESRDKHAFQGVPGSTDG
ncbi:hypothetical protein WOLCODRAFT_163296 [Wolfiporia cocos MD-104 SS10]|uniref:DUF6534 domain-containing protein n=1 Tax=Wolfiporia cocos (strain MD-104) TaxID=742152 RepID=A0A2H3JHK6_WOLCO|nr:hypothetical protein WOLCODRAFT_163296 [Wolfiporia cocos MD-104 SS10]